MKGIGMSALTKINPQVCVKKQAKNCFPINSLVNSISLSILLSLCLTPSNYPSPLQNSNSDPTPSPTS